MTLFDAPDYADHEHVLFCRDAKAGLRAIIAIHNTRLGPALGGCRIYPYASDGEALRDVLRLARGMTYKAALAGLALGGGKTVVIADPQRDKSDALLRALGRSIDALGGRYVTAEDSGATVADMRAIAQETPHVTGFQWRDEAHTGDPSPHTAQGVYIGLCAALRRRLGVDTPRGLRVALQGAGSVGMDLARRLHAAGAELIVADAQPQRIREAVERFGARAVAPEAIHAQEAEIFAPCAMGAILNDETIPALRAQIVAGAANNQLAEARHAQALRERNILYAPDYAINAGGIIDVYSGLHGENAATAEGRLEQIGATLEAIFAAAERGGETTAAVADQMAERRLNAAHPDGAEANKPLAPTA